MKSFGIIDSQLRECLGVSKSANKNTTIAGAGAGAAAPRALRISTSTLDANMRSDCLMQLPSFHKQHDGDGQK